MRPDYLQEGDTIAIISPARFVDRDRIEIAESIFKKNGFNVIKGKNILKKKHQFSATDLQRAADLQEMINHTDVKAIIAAGGGYGSVRLLSYLDFTPLLKKPKWLIGFSDVTVLHTVLNETLKIESIHGIMPVKFTDEPENLISVQNLINAMKGELNKYELEYSSFNRTGRARGKLVGGNLSILYSLMGTPYQLNLKNKILFIEDVDEYHYHIDRMLQSFALSGQLSQLNGLIVGDFTDIHDHEIPFGKSVPEIIHDLTREYYFPVAYNLRAGHGNMNLSLYLGREITLNVNNEFSSLVF